MSNSLDLVQYQWMGYNGTESEYAALLREIKKKPELGCSDQESILDELELRLLIIKVECNLLPAAVLKSMIKEHDDEILRRLEEEEARRRKRQEDFYAAIRSIEKEEEDDRFAVMKEQTAEAFGNETSQYPLLRAGLALPSNSYRKVNLFDLSNAVRGYLCSKDCGYVCYLDGTFHLRIDELNDYSERLDKILKEKYGGRIKLPRFRSYLTNNLYLAKLHLDNCRQAVDADRCITDPGFVARLRVVERRKITPPGSQQNADQKETQEGENGSEAEKRSEMLVNELEKAKKVFEELRREYNLSAQNCADAFFANLRNYDGKGFDSGIWKDEMSPRKENVEEDGDPQYLKRLSYSDRKLMYYKEKFNVEER